MFIIVSAIAYSWIISWVADVRKYVKLRLGTAKVPGHPDAILEDTLEIFQSRREEIPNNEGNIRMSCTDSRSMTCQSLDQSNECSSKSMHCITNTTKSAEFKTENNSDLRKKSTLRIDRNIMPESLEGVYRKLEEMEINISTKLRKIINKDTDKRIEKHEIALQRIRKRFESFEKKTQSTSIQGMTENYSGSTSNPSLNIRMDNMAESLEVLYKKLEEMEQTNAIQLKNNTENNKETDKCLKLLKEQEEATKIDLQGMRKRFESFEKKKHLGYYN